MADTSSPSENESELESEFDRVLAGVIRSEEEGRQIDRGEWILRHPDLADELREYFDDRDALDGVVQPLRDVLGAKPATAEVGARIRYLGDYELLEEIGRGGMGVIYRARQVSLKRIVAIKMIGSGLSDAKRFRAEAEAAASLDHPNIVPIYEIGEHESCSYFSMKLIEGGSLSESIAGGLMPPGCAAQVAATVAKAVHFAHQHGILHRDLKPGNVLIDTDNQPHVADFGLAKDITADSHLTHSGELLGTPSYMSPEQALGGAASATTAADVYGIGAILYAMLSGRAPFVGETPLETLDMVRGAALAPPRQFADVPRDLETICLKCLEREPASRYDSAQAVAQDIERFLRDEPIHARPVGTLERCWRWSRRNRLVASLSLAIVVLLLVAAVGGTTLAVRERAARQAADKTRDQEAAARRAADDARNDAVSARSESEAALVEMFSTYGLAAPSPEQDAEKVLWFAAAAKRAASHPRAQQENAIRTRTYAREVPLPVRALKTPLRSIRRISFHPSGRHLLLETSGGRCYLWDILSDDGLVRIKSLPSVTRAAFCPDGLQIVLAGKDGRVGLFDLATGSCIVRWRQAGPIHAVCFSNSGRLLAAAGKEVRVFDCQQRTFKRGPLIHPQEIDAVAFSGAGDRIATACRDQKLRIFSLRDGQTSGPIIGAVKCEPAISTSYQRVPIVLAFSPDDSAVMFPSGRGLIASVDSASGKTLWRNRVGGTLSSMSIDPNHKLFFIGGTRNGRVRSVESGSRGMTISHRHVIFNAVFRPDGGQLATASWDRTVRIWSTQDRNLVARLPHQSGVANVAYSADGAMLASAQVDGLLKVWQLSRPNPRVRRLPVGSPATLAKFSGDGRFVMATGTSYNGCRLNEQIVYETASGEAAGPAYATDGIIVDASFSTDGEHVVAAVSYDSNRHGVQRGGDNSRGRIERWNIRTGRLVTKSPPLTAEPRSVCVSPDGRRVALFCSDGDVRLLSGESLAVVQTIPCKRPWSSTLLYDNNGVVRFTPDANAVLLFGTGKDVSVWETATGKLRFPPLRHDRFVNDVDISPDGKTLVTASYDRMLRFFDLTSGSVIHKPVRHPDMLFRVRFTRDGRHVLTSCRDNQVRLIKVGSGALEMPPAEHDEEVFDARLTPDGRSIVSVSLDSTLRVSSRRTGKLVMPPVKLAGGGWCVDITADGRWAVASGGGGGLTLVDLADLIETDPLGSGAGLLGELLAGRSIRGDQVVALSSDEWFDRFMRLSNQHPDLLGVRWTKEKPPKLAHPQLSMSLVLSRMLARATSPYVHAARRQLIQIRDKWTDFRHALP